MQAPARLRDRGFMKAHSLRVERGNHHITDEHLADAIELLLTTRPLFSGDLSLLP